jgi:hypothetical protein
MTPPHLPPEIWTEIAYFACTDGGKTAVSLLRVSKSISEAALIHAYTTVALTGTRSVQLFLNLVTDLTPTQRARIRDIYICQPALESDVSQDINAEGNNSIISNPDRPMGRLLQFLMPLVSPTMRSLALVTFSDVHRSADSSLMHALTIVPLHALRHLTFHTIDHSSMPRSSLPLPAVTHLHASCRNYSHLRWAMTNIVFLARSMSHLSQLSLYGLPSSLWTRTVLQVILGQAKVRDRLVLRAHVKSVRLLFEMPALASDDKDRVRDLQTFLESAVGQHRMLEFLGPEDRAPDTPEGWLAFWLGQVIDMPDGDAQTNTAVAD